MLWHHTPNKSAQFVTSSVLLVSCFFLIINDSREMAGKLEGKRKKRVLTEQNRNELWSPK